MAVPLNGSAARCGSASSELPELLSRLARSPLPLVPFCAWIGQFAHALQQSVTVASARFGGLRQRDTVVGVADRDVDAADLVHAVGDGQAGGVVLAELTRRPTTAAASRSTGTLRHVQVSLRVERRVGVDGLRHECTLNAPRSAGSSTGASAPADGLACQTVSSAGAPLRSANRARNAASSAAVKAAGPEGAACRQTQRRAGQRSSDSTFCGSWLALRHHRRAGLLQDLGAAHVRGFRAKSASMMRPRAAFWFSPAICRLLDGDRSGSSRRRRWRGWS